MGGNRVDACDGAQIRNRATATRYVIFGGKERVRRPRTARCRQADEERCARLGRLNRQAYARPARTRGHTRTRSGTRGVTARQPAHLRARAARAAARRLSTIPLAEVTLRASRSSGPGASTANVRASRLEASSTKTFSPRVRLTTLTRALLARAARALAAISQDASLAARNRAHRARAPSAARIAPRARGPSSQSRGTNRRRPRRSDAGPQAPLRATQRERRHPRASFAAGRSRRRSALCSQELPDEPLVHQPLCLLGWKRSRFHS